MKKKIFAGLLGVTFCVIYFAVAMLFMPLSYGWYTGGKTMFFNAAGSSVASYFESGKGTHEDPYIISNPKHMYNLAWLQYLGMFNETDSDGNLKEQYHFKLKNDIDMTVPVGGVVYQAIPPIGTMEYPFVGHFDGNGKTVSNVIVANSKKAGAIIQSPPAIESGVVRYAEIIGFFGVIGEYNGVGKVTDDQLKALVVENLNLDNITIATSTTSSLAGLFAGYVNGTAKNVNVLGGTIDTAENVLPYTETFNVTGEDADGNSVIKEFILNAAGAISNYTLIGDYLTTLIKWEGGGVINGPTGDQGQGQGFGGSIDILSLAKRITYMLKAGVKDGYMKYPEDDVVNAYHMYGYYSKITNGDDAYTYESKYQIFYIGQKSTSSPTYLPLNINLDNLKDTFYAGLNEEEVLTSNTGYLVGGNGNIAIASRQFGRIYKSFGGNSGSWSTYDYDDTYDQSSGKSYIQILTRNADGTYVIGDSYNQLASGGNLHYSGISMKTWSNLGFTQYEGTNNVRGKLEEMLKSSGATLNGMKLGSNSPLATKKISVDVTLAGQSVTSLLQGSINFRVAGKGVITLVAGTFEGGSMQSLGTGAQSAPDLYQITRDPSTKDISAITKITTVYEYNGEYTYNEKPHANATLVYDEVWTNNLSAGNDQYLYSLFYFEIPVNEGEYAFCNGNAYLLYLDIGGNAGSGGGSGEGGSGGTEPPPQPTGEISGIAFAYQNGTTYTKITHDGTNVVTYKISGPKDSDGNPVKTHSGAAITFTPSNASNMEVAFSNSNTGQFAVSKNDPPNTGSG